MSQDRIAIWEAKESCSCNVCHAPNYELPTLLAKHFTKEDRLLNVQIGGTVATLCSKCALKMMRMIEAEICEGEEK